MGLQQGSDSIHPPQCKLSAVFEHTQGIDPFICGLIIYMTLYVHNDCIITGSRKDTTGSISVTALELEVVICVDWDS